MDQRAKILISSIRRLARKDAWKNIERILEKAHTADIASIIEALSREEGLKLFRMIQPIDKRAEVLSYFKAYFQKDTIDLLEKKEVSDLVSEMASDDAADLLAQFPDDRSAEILSGLKEDSEEVAELMAYPEDSAGGLMSSDYLALNQDLNVSDAIKEIQTKGEEGLITFYVYVVDDLNHLIGVLSLKQLLLNKPTVPLKTIMSSDIISVRVDTDQEIVAKTVEKYDYLSIPVVDAGNELIGVVTVDDAIDVIREEAQEDFLAMGRAGSGVSTYLGHLQARLPWLLLSFLGGGVGFYLVYRFLAHAESFKLYLALVPLLI